MLCLYVVLCYRKLTLFALLMLRDDAIGYNKGLGETSEASSGISQTIASVHAASTLWRRDPF